MSAMECRGGGREYDVRGGRASALPGSRTRNPHACACTSRRFLRSRPRGSRCSRNDIRWLLRLKSHPARKDIALWPRARCSVVPVTWIEDRVASSGRGPPRAMKG